MAAEISGTSPDGRLRHFVRPRLYNLIAKLKTTMGEQAQGVSQPANTSQSRDGFGRVAGSMVAGRSRSHGATCSTGRCCPFVAKAGALMSR